MTDEAQNVSATNGGEEQEEGVLQKLADKAREVVAEVKEELAEVKEEIGEALAEAREKASEVLAEVKERVGLGGDDEATEEAGATFEPSGDEDGTTPRRLADLHAGMELDGKVTSTALYGVFVDIGVGRDGLVHISEMSDQRIESPTDVVQIGDIVKVRVKSVDPDARRISLTMRSPRSEGRRRAPKRPEVNNDKLGELKPGDLVDGTVNGIAPFGVFVDIGVGKDGLVHISELSENRVEKAEDAVTVGQSYTFRVLEVDTGAQRISLSLRRAKEDFQERPKAPRRREVNLDVIAPGTVLDGKVSGIAPFGAFVDLGVGRDGLVHISELSEGRVGKVDDVVKVGDPVKVRVLEVDPDSKRISLTMRVEEAPTTPISTSGSSRLDRDWSNPASREERPAREERRAVGGGNPGGNAGGGRRNERRERPAREPEIYSVGGTEEEDFGGNATLDDLLSKFGSGHDDRRSARRRYEKPEQEEEDGFENRESRARRDAIRRTLRDSQED